MTPHQHKGLQRRPLDSLNVLRKGAHRLTLTKYFRDQFLRVSLTKSRESVTISLQVLRLFLQWLHLKNLT